MLNYNAPENGQLSTVDASSGTKQMETFVYMKKAIITARREMFFSPLASTYNMPKHYGKTIKVYEYIPLLDARNVNDQGLDAAGATIANGNLYGSSRDVGTITNKLPVLSETGGRVNRVGFTRIAREGSMHQFGFFFEFTKESMDFDSDPMLMEHLARELMTGAVQLTEAVLQRDLLASAGVIVYAGAAVSDATISGEVTPAAGAVPELPISEVSYLNLVRLDTTLTDNRTPKMTKVISGSRMIDTKVINSARVMFIGSELVLTVKSMRDQFGDKAYVSVEHYADAGTILNGEIGTVADFRIVLVPEMLHWAGAGKAVTNNPGYRTSMKGGVERYDVYPMLVVGDDSFTQIGFETDGKSLKFNVMTKMPGKEMQDKLDPYGLTGISSIRWWYGFLCRRPERIAMVKTVARI